MDGGTKPMLLRVRASPLRSPASRYNFNASSKKAIAPFLASAVPCLYSCTPSLNVFSAASVVLFCAVCGGFTEGAAAATGWLN